MLAGTCSCQVPKERLILRASSSWLLLSSLQSTQYLSVFVVAECEKLQELTPDQVVALVSCTVWQERAEVGQKVREDMQGPFAALTQVARTVGKVHFHLQPPDILA